MRRLVRYCIWQISMLFLFAITSYAQTPILAVADFFSRYIFRFNATTGALIDILPTDIATQADLHDPQILTFGPDGDLYVPTVSLPNSPPPLFGGGILRFSHASGASLGVFAFDPGNGPRGITFGPNGNVYATTGNSIQRFDGKSGAFIDAFVPCCSPELFDSQGLRFGPDGNLYVVSTPLSTYPTGNVVKYDGKTGALLGIFSSGTSPSLPHDLVFGPDGNLYVGSVADGQILRYNGQTGSFMGAFVPRGSGGLDSPWGLAFGPDGNLYVSSYHNGFRNGNSGGVLRFNGPKNQNPGAPIDLFIPTNGDIVFETPSGLAFSNTVGCELNPDSVKLDTLYNNEGIIATFKPKIGGIPKLLDEAASACGFAGFDWSQIVDRLPPPGLGLGQSGTPVLQVPPGLPFFDPPLGGYKYQWDDLPLWLHLQPGFATANPFYYSPSDIPIGCAEGGAAVGPCLVPVRPDANTLNFYDIPHSSCLPGGKDYGNTNVCGLVNPFEFLGFTTDLVGYLPCASCPSGYKPSAPLFEWTWNSNFSGTTCSAAACGGIFFVSDVEETASAYPPDPGTGAGGIAITSVNGVPQRPPSLTCTANPTSLWPPDGKLVVVTVSGSIIPGSQTIPPGGMSFAVKDEYGQVQPSGNFAPSAGGSYSFGVPLVAARNGDDKDGRTYAIVLAGRDAIGNVGSCSTVVTVPHDQGK